MIAMKIILLITLYQVGATSGGLSWRPPDRNFNKSLQNQFISPNRNETSTSQSIKPVQNMFFKASSNDSSMILTDMANCMSAHNMLECCKMFLLIRIKSLVIEMDKRNTTGVDYSLLNGMVVFKWRNESHTENLRDFPENLDLSRTLNIYVQQLFRSRSLQVMLFPGVGLELTPKAVQDENGLMCFTAKTFKADFKPFDSDEVLEMRKKGDKGKKKKKGGGFNMMPMMIVPQMIMLGMLPFALANLKMMVMNAFMMNSMALNGAIAMTIRNMVFGPKNGPRIKYVNYGYNKPKKNKKPELILHSPAAFVKKPHHKNYVSRNEPEKPPNRLRVKSPVQPPSEPYTHEFPIQHDDSFSPVDAPVSYANDHQPGSNNYENDDTGPSSYDGYQAYSNIHLQPYEDQGVEGSENKHSYSSTYKENTNYYPNHRLHR